jgi:Ca-activated chloride channel family protein
MAAAGKERTTIVKVQLGDRGRHALVGFIVGLGVAGLALAATAPAAPGAAAGQSSAAARPAAQRGMQIQMVSPPSGTPAFGEVDLAVRVKSPVPLKWVDYYVDGQRAGRVEAPPWKLRFDVGQSNAGHQVRAIAEDVLGGKGEALVKTGSIASDMSFDVRLQQLFVSVTNAGQSVQGLAQGDFEIVNDEGDRESITTFGGGDLPISSVLLLDSSESMKGEPLQAALAGVRAFVDRTRADDETMVAFFSDRLLAATTFIKDDAALQRALGEVKAAGGTAVNDHLYYALNRLQPRLGRRVVVLLSDGLDVSSALDMEQVLSRARRSQAMIYWLRLDDPATAAKGVPRYASIWRGYDDNARQYSLLEQAVTESGGRVLKIRQLGEIDDAFRQVVDELRQQYVLGFQPRDARGRGNWRPLKVKVRGDEFAVRTRAGFVD